MHAGPMSRLCRAVARLRARAAQEQGFGLIELMVAVAIVLVSLLAVAYTALASFQDIAFARQRQSATGLANQVIEQARALPLDTLTRGLSNADLSSGGDSNITSSGCGSGTVYCLHVDGLNEQIPRGDNPSVVPLVPHAQSIKVGDTTYTVRIYVSYFNSDPSLNKLRLTAIVTWTGPERRSAAHKVDVQSLVASPPGCLSTRTHPFSAPCQPFLYSTTGGSLGQLTVDGTLANVQLEHLGVSLPSYSSALQVEQTSAVQATAATSSVDLQLLDGPDTVLGGASVSTGADSDPAQTDPGYQTASINPQVAQSISATGTGVSLTGSITAGDSGSSTSTTSASNSPSHPCPNIAGLTNLLTNQPCGASTGQFGGNTGLSLGLNILGINLGLSNLVSLAPMPCVVGPCPVNRAASYRFVLPNGSMCPGTNTDGCVHAEVTRNLGTVTVGGLPPAILPPPGWQGYLVRLSSWQDTASAESGIGSAAPAAQSPQSGSGTISFWNGTGYTTCTVYQTNCPPANSTYPIPTLSLSQLIGLIPVNVQVSASLSAGGTSTTQTPANCSGTCTRTKATSTAGSPLLGNVETKITILGQVVCDLTVHVDLGTTLVNTSYAPAPTA
jgi:prepilin-type N-terminal cleavage/methylation domain-containing protein